jgi:hypothetical protein
MNQEQQTYQTDHPTIKEISIGDQFESGVHAELLEFVGLSDDTEFDYNYIEFENPSKYPFKFNLYDKNTKLFITHEFYTKSLLYSFDNQSEFDIIRRYIPLKDKLNSL